jgi:hypothetical protein
MKVNKTGERATPKKFYLILVFLNKYLSSLTLVLNQGAALASYHYFACHLVFQILAVRAL